MMEGANEVCAASSSDALFPFPSRQPFYRLSCHFMEEYTEGGGQPGLRPAFPLFLPFIMLH
jgi:hypothetical protein